MRAWLDKEQRCPHCRAPAQPGQLVRVFNLPVLQQPQDAAAAAGASAAGLSQSEVAEREALLLKVQQAKHAAEQEARRLKSQLGKAQVELKARGLKLEQAKEQEADAAWKLAHERMAQRGLQQQLWSLGCRQALMRHLLGRAVGGDLRGQGGGGGGGGQEGVRASLEAAVAAYLTEHAAAEILFSPEEQTLIQAYTSDASRLHGGHVLEETQGALTERPLTLQERASLLATLSGLAASWTRLQATQRLAATAAPPQAKRAAARTMQPEQQAVARQATAAPMASGKVDRAGVRPEVGEDEDEQRGEPGHPPVRRSKRKLPF
ncbi:hypothetical protein HYH03_000429 [Edaphochlamys debaryana]|uniref:Uncharacterized protein n=1 Tax=Edaphochlamys debaryana TaxID=47281 RepID=A0A835YG48_9CHLO|nr:hypothetical protein HYH03_000429 [Edaphochlamys debaryana]|eukprot:KAG2501931.1 hypothetical protein HYH03_000429 [Edaphochlamys debaryana]